MKDIARQLLEFPYGDGLEVALGGGRSYFMPNTAAIRNIRPKKAAAATPATWPRNGRLNTTMPNTFGIKANSMR